MSADDYEPLDDRDLRTARHRLPAELVSIMTEAGRPLAIVGGGFLRTIVARERSSDVDVFSENASNVEQLAKAYAARLEKTRKVETDNAITIIASGRLPVQFIKRWTFNGAPELLDSFDFSIARAALWHVAGGWHGLAHRRFYRDLAAKRLVYLAPKHNTAGGTLLRLQKFVARGYRASAYNIASIAQGLAAQAGASVDVVTSMARLVREVDPFSPEWVDNPPPPAADTPPDDDIDF